MATARTRTVRPRATSSARSPARKSAPANGGRAAAPARAQGEEVTSVAALERLFRAYYDTTSTLAARAAAAAALRSLTGAGLDVLLGYTVTPRAPHRVAALAVLGDIGKARGGARVGPTLARFLAADQKWFAQASALDAAARAGAEPVRPHAERLLGDDAGFVRAAAMRFLAAVPDAQSASLLRAVLAAPRDTTDLINASAALGALRDREAVPALVALFDHRSRPVVRAAVAAVGHIGDPIAIGPVQTLRDAGDADANLRSVCNKALASLRRVTRRAAR